MEANEMNVEDRPEQRLSQRVVRGGIWVFALRIVYRGMVFARTIVLARLLAPGDFGLFGIALLAMSTLQSFSETGVGATLVQKKDDIRSYLNTGWTIQIIRGAFLAGLLFVCAPFIASFFQEPKASPILQVLAASVFFDGLQNIGILYFKKELQFHKLFVYQIGGALADLSVAIPVALLLHTVWALAFGLLARSVVCCILSYVIHPYRPRLEFKLSKVRELYNFGRWVSANRILNFLHLQGDDIFVGRLLGVVSLGFYQMAYRLSNMPSTEITLVVSGVTFPAYSKLQDSLQELRSAFFRTLKLVALVTIPLASGIFVLSPGFAEIFLGEKWMPIVPTIRVLSIYGAARSILGVFGPLFYGAGRPRALVKIRLIQLIALIAIIYPFALRWDALGVAIAISICKLVVLALAMIEAGRILDVSTFDFGKAIFIPAASSLVIFLSPLIVRRTFPANIGVIGFFSIILIGAIVYPGCVYLFDRFSNYGIKGNLLAVLRSI